MSGNNSKDNALSPELEHNVFIKLPSPAKEKFLSPTYQLKFHRMLDKQYPRKNRFRLQYSMRRSWPFDTSTDNSLNSNLDYDSCIYTSIYRVPVLSRSAKIMKALSITPSLSRHKSIDGSDIRRLLNFDSTPSSKENSYENSSSSINTPSPTLNSSLTDSTDSNVPTVESIDENQNQTPQQNRKHIKISRNKADVNVHDQHTYMRPRTSYLMSLLAKEQKERTNKDANHGISVHPFCSFNSFDNGSNRPSRIITASTPRNLSEEFNQEIHDRPHTPENMIDVIPESISAIKKSHKKEKLYCHEEQASTHRTDISVKNDDLHPKTTTKSSEIDIIAETSAASESESQMKNRNTKRTLIYNVDDEHPNIKSTETDLLESRLDQIESDEMQKIDSIDRESHEENIEANIHLVDNDKDEENRSKKNVCNEEVSQLSLQESSDTYNANATRENRIASPESNSIISQNANKVVTPENYEKNMSMNVLVESIKKSHKKMKHENRKQLFTRKDLRQDLELAKSEISLENACNDDQDNKSQMADMIRVSSPQNLEFDRPSTPENVNSSRLLLLDFNSVKKSHKKGKRSKRISSFAECHGYEYRKRSNDSLQSSRYEDENVGEISYRKHESLGLKESPGILPKKKKTSSSMSLQSSTPKMSSAFVSLGYKNIDDEFKIYTPIKKQPILLTVTDYIPADEMSQERESAQATSNEIDCSRCTTPIARFKALRKTEDLASERDNATRFETDVRVLKATDTGNLKDNNGRSTPINMSTMELLNNIDSIKKSHKKNKHSHSKRQTSKKKQSYIQESGYVNFTNSEKMLEERVDNHCTKETDYDNPQPSTSQGGDNIENAKSIKSKFLNTTPLNTTPPNTSSAMNFIKLLHKTSIKKSHKKERDMNAQTKYIFMSQEHDLSDDGSIFDEQDRLNFMDISDNNTEITTM